MIVAWIGYCLLVSALLGVAALAAERALGHYRKPVRWVWATALAGSLLLPIVAYVAPTLFARFSAVTPGLPVAVTGLPAFVVTGGAPDAATGGIDWGAVLSVAGIGLGALWALSIVTLGAYLFVAQRRLRREMSEWTPSEVLDAPVLMSPDRGPAVVGVRRGVIVMPAWIAELEDDVLRLVFLHEREHQLAGDHRLFALALVGLVAMPWNPFAWWQLRRLRLAIEFDCDRRVLRQGVQPRDYAEALLVVGSRVTSLPLAAAAFAERRPAMEERLRRMTEPLRRRRGLRAALAVAIGAFAVLLALGSPFPTLLRPDAGTVSGYFATQAKKLLEKVEGPKRKAEASAQPMFLPYDTPPALLNREEIAGVLRGLYPAELRDAGIGGRVELWLYLDEEGEIANSLVKTPSGHPAFDKSALAVARRMEFSPAELEGERTPVWFSQWITFQTEGSDGAAAPTNFRVKEIGEESSGAKGSGGAAGGVLRRRSEYGEQIQAQQVLEGDPLIVVDGVIQPADTRIEHLRSLDIDHVEVIKGEAAIELYGERARDGVIQIVTKEGAAGQLVEIREVPLPSDQSTLRAKRVKPDAEVEIPVLGHTYFSYGRTESPLIVIDGVAQDESATLSNIEELEIESVEVIKGEAAIELYGERAKDGAIQIKTKGG